MLPAQSYTPLFFHGMLLVVSACALLYWIWVRQGHRLSVLNRVAFVAIAVGLILFIGLRPISGIFVDMPIYARGYERAQQGFQPQFSDWLFGLLVRTCSNVLPVEAFFLVCALVYIAPLAFASWHIHGDWAFPVFLAFLSAFSFWAYGVNGMRNGMATSVLVLAFAFHDKPLLMLALMVAAWGFHGSVVLPAGAFLLVRYVPSSGLWMMFWLTCAGLSLFAGNVGQKVLAHYNPFEWEARAEAYILGAQGTAFRGDFIAYSIVPVLITLFLSGPTRGSLRQLMRYAGAAQHQSKRTPLAPARNSSVQARSAPFWSRRPVCGNPYSLFYVQGAALGTEPGRTAMVHGSGATRSLGHLDLRTSTPEPMSRDVRRAFRSLPWVRLLRLDPFYARLVNAYLFSNAIWVLLIYANFSNRFAYLSWFMMPWLLLYPFVPGRVVRRPRLGFVAAVLLAHYLFTYIMWMVFYRMSF